jgi:hypothetical protein
MARALEQILQAQQRPDALVERVLVRDDGIGPAGPEGRAGSVLDGSLLRRG